MSDFELVLDECLTQLASGVSTVDECLARHPEHAAQLVPLLQSALRFEGARNIKPSPIFKARTRGQLTNYMKAHPRHRSWTVSPFWRVGVSLAALVAAFLVTGTVFAQGALPGQALYAWKLSSENIWRAVAPDPVAVDLTFADRRVAEMTAVAENPAEEAQAQKGYLEVLARLKSESDTQNQSLILQTLKSHQTKLSAAGISIPNLDHYLLPSGSNSGSNSISTTVPELSPTSVSPKSQSTAVPIVPPGLATSVPKIIPTLHVPPLGP